VPVQGIQEGHPKDSPAVKDDRSVHKGETQARTDVDPGNESTTETSDAADGGRAIVLIPERLRAVSGLEVLFHLHGHTIGYRQPREDAKPPDEDIYRLEQQIDGSNRPMIAVLPQGDIGSNFWRGRPKRGKATGPPPVFNVDDYIREAVGKVPQPDWPGGKAPTDWSVVLSGHSGGGAALSALFTDESRLPKHLTGLLEFDAVNQRPGGIVGDITSGAEFSALEGFVRRRLGDDLTKIRAVAAANAKVSGPALQQLQKSKLEQEGFQFRAIFTGNRHFADRAKGKLDPDKKASYADRYLLIERAVLQWLADHKKDVGAKGDPVFDAFLTNYTFASAGEGVDHMAEIGANLQSVLTSLGARP
jgi:hypothetical protein